MQRPSKKMRSFMALLPLFLLAGDWLFFPTFFQAPQSLLISSIMFEENPHSPPPRIGSISGHNVFWAEDGDPADDSYVEYLDNGPNGLVIDVDLTNRKIGPAFRGTLRKLMRLAPAESKKMIELTYSSDPAPGEIYELDIQSPINQFRIKHLSIVGVNYESVPEEKQKQVMSGLRKVVASAKKTRTTNLVIPMLTVNPGNPKYLQFNQFFPIAVKPLADTGWYPRNVYFSFLTPEWDSYRTEAKTALEKAWNDQRQEMQKESVLFHENFRLVLVCCSLALVVSLITLPATWDRIAAVLLLFTGIGFGAIEAADKLMPGYSAEIMLWVHIIVLIVIAGGFPFLVRWDPKKLFSPTVNR